MIYLGMVILQRIVFFPFPEKHTNVLKLVFFLGEISLKITYKKIYQNFKKISTLPKRMLNGVWKEYLKHLGCLMVYEWREYLKHLGLCVCHKGEASIIPRQLSLLVAFTISPELEKVLITYWRRLSTPSGTSSRAAGTGLTGLSAFGHTLFLSNIVAYSG